MRSSRASRAGEGSIWVSQSDVGALRQSVGLGQLWVVCGCFVDRCRRVLRGVRVCVFVL
jgi:hypothetical protein